jgi:hypothetical protein
MHDTIARKSMFPPNWGFEHEYARPITVALDGELKMQS